MKPFLSPRLLLLGGCLWYVVGCGSSSDNASEHKESASEESAAGTTEQNGPAVGTTAADRSSPVAPVDQANGPVVVEPTAEQIARWTPAPFEPLELLAIHEWEKTSFTARIAAVPDGKHFIAVGSRVLLWSIDDAKTPEHVFLELTAEDGDRHQQALAIAPDGNWFAVGDSEGTLRIWSLVDKSELTTKQLYATGIQDLAISPDGKEIATISYDNEITIWSAPGLEEKKKFEVSTNFVKRLEYVAPQVLAAAGESTSSWNTSTGAMIAELSPGRYSHALARSADGAKFIFGGDEKLVIWDAKASKRESEITQHVSGDEQVAFSPDGKYLATNSGNTIQLWNLAERRVVQVIDSFGWPITGVCWLPETNLLVIASDIGVTRIWGTAEKGAAFGLKPLHAKITKFDTPASPIQMHEVIDLRVLPRLPDSEMSITSIRDLSCVAPVSVAEAMTFYRYFLTQAGWTESDTPSANPSGLVFQKNGFRITASFYDAGEGKTTVSLTHQGNFDMRSVPKFDGAAIEPSYEGEDNMSYRTKADLLSIETTLLRKLHAASWTGFVRLNTSHSEPADARDLEFLKNGTTLLVSVGKFPVAPESYTIQYSPFPNNSIVPVPPDAGYVEFDGSTDPKLIATTTMSLEEASEFYDKELTKEGWLKRGRGHTMKDEYAWLNYLREQNDLTIGLTKLPDGRTLVRVGEASGSLWEGSLPPEEENGEAEKVAVGLEAADFPILNASKTAKFDAIEKTVEVLIDDSTLASAADEYTKALESLGWKHDGRGIRDEEYTFLTYEKGDVDISLRAHPKDGNALVSFAGDGLLWTKELPGGKELVSYERWLRLNKLPAGLEQIDRYEAEMRAIGKP